MVNGQLNPLFIIYGTPNGTTTFNIRRRDSLHIMTFMKDISSAEKQYIQAIAGYANGYPRPMTVIVNGGRQTIATSVLDWLKDYKAAF